METIGLIAAMSQESGALLRQVRGWKRVSLVPFRCVRFQIANRDCLLVTSGMGIQRAAQATDLLLKEFNPTLLISFGIAGAVEADLEIGDVITATRTCLLEGKELKQFSPLTSLSGSALQAVAQALLPRGAHLFNGTAVTTRGAQVLPSLSDNLEHPILEMETVGIASVAEQRGVPLVSLRAISDGPQAPIPFDLESVTDKNYNFRVWKMLGAILRQPRLLVRAGQMMRNASLTAGNAATALLAALEQPAQITTLITRPGVDQ